MLGGVLARLTTVQSRPLTCYTGWGFDATVSASPLSTTFTVASSNTSVCAPASRAADALICSPASDVY